MSILPSLPASPVVDQFDIPDEVLDVLHEAGRPLSDVLTTVDGRTVVDMTLVDQLRNSPAGDEDIPAVFSTLEEDEAEDLSSSDVVDDIDWDTFSFAPVVAELDILDTAGALAELLRYRPAYVRAARQAKKKNPEADFYNAVNGPLFRARAAAQERVAASAASVSSDDPAQRISARRDRMAVEMLTELIVRFNYGMTRNYVRLFTSNTSRDDSEDFQGAAILGLMNSIDTFNPDLGKFGSWAYKRIQREVLRAVRDADYKSMNHGDFERRPDIIRAYAKLAGPEETRTPSFEEVAAEVGCTVDLVKRVLAAPHLASIHEPIRGNSGDETELGELIPDHAVPIDDQVIGEMDVAALAQFGLSVLDAREHYVLARRFGLDGEPAQCLSSIGKQLRLSREAVRQIEAKALARLMHPATLSRIVRHGRP